jgi:phage tail-like protein
MADESFPNCRFYVEIDSLQAAMFTEVSGLQVEMEVFEYQEGGMNDFVYRLPGRTKVGNITLKRGMTRSNDFFHWCMEVAGGQITRRNVAVVMYDVAGKEVLRWNFVGAYPVKWVGSQFQAAGNTPAIETLELAHNGLQRNW